MRAALTLVAWLGASLGACADAKNDLYFGRVPEPDPAHLTICGMGEPDSLDPALASSATDLKIVYELFDGLTTFDPEGLPAPSLATSWEASPDLRRFTFHLRNDASWSNGRPLVAEDFVYSFARLLHPLTASTNVDALHRLRHGKEYNAGTARLVLADAAPFRAGDAVVALDKDAADPAASPNVRVARVAIPLRAAPRADAEVWATAPAASRLTIVERRCDGRACWAYLASSVGEGTLGWAPLAEDTLAAPNDDRSYRVKSLDGEGEGTVRGRDLLMLPELLGVRAADAHTLVIETVGPTPYAVELTQQRAYRPVPREAVSRWPRTWTEPGHIVTSGPFHLAEHRARDKIELVRSPTFFGSAKVRLARVTFLAIDNQTAAANIYFQGGCDALTANGLPLSYVPAVADKKDFRAAPYLGTYFIMVNSGRFPNVHFRRALGLALDRDLLRHILGQWASPTDRFVPGTPIGELTSSERTLCGVGSDDRGVALIVEKDRLCYVPPPGLAYDPEAARHEFQLARAELGDRLPKRIVYLFNSGFEHNKLIAQWAQAEWQRVLGIDVQIDSQDFKTYLKTTAAGEYDVARMAWLGSFADPESEYLNVFKCGAPDNRVHLCDPEVDRLLAEAATDGDRAHRLALVRQVEERVVASASVIPLFHTMQDHLQKPYVRDLYVNLTDHQSLRATWIDADWRRR